MLSIAGLMATTVVGASLALPATAPAPAAKPSANVAKQTVDYSRLRPDLLAKVKTARPDELIRISVVMREQIPDGQIKQLARLADKQQRREAVVASLKNVADWSTRDLLAAMKTEQDAGQVGERVRSLWISNVVVAEATPGAIMRIAKRHDVAHINYDKLVGEELFPVEPGTGGGTLLGDRDVECGVDIMRAPEVWDDFGLTGLGVVVGVIDTGCCITHPDLANQIWNNPGEIPGDGIDNDGNGYIDDIVGWNFKDDTDDPYDTNSHGTHVAGTVGGDGTEGTQTGMAPDVSIMVLKYWNSFSGESVAWEAIQYGVDNNADVLTGSFGWPHSMSPDRPTWRNTCEAAMAAGVVMNFAAGNEGSYSPPYDNVRTPGDVPDVITVGGTTCSDSTYTSSSRGPITWQDVPPFYDWVYPPGKIKPTISAPSVDTVSTSTSGGCHGYSTKTGTSMGTPHNAGAIALMLQANPSLDHFDVKQILMDTAVDLGDPGMDNIFGAGRVDAYEAVVVAMQSGCEADVTGDGVVDVLDLLDILAAWGGSGPEDINGDGVVDVLDLLEVLGAWGPC